MPMFFDRFWAGQRRAKPRIAGDIPAALYAEGGEAVIHGTARDLGMGGLCIATRSPFAAGSIVRIALRARAASVSVEVSGLWQEYEDGEKTVLTGFAFGSLSKAERKAISALVSQAIGRIARTLQQTRLPELGIEDAMAIAELVRFRSFRSGRVVYGNQAHDQHAGSLFVVEQGLVSLHLATPPSRRVALALVDQGDLFGGFGLGAPGPFPEVAVAECDSRLLEIHTNTFAFVRRHRPELALQLAVAASRAASLRYCAALLATEPSPGLGGAAPPPLERGSSA